MYHFPFYRNSDWQTWFFHLILTMEQIWKTWGVKWRHTYINQILDVIQKYCLTEIRNTVGFFLVLDFTFKHSSSVSNAACFSTSWLSTNLNRGKENANFKEKKKLISNLVINLRLSSNSLIIIPIWIIWWGRVLDRRNQRYSYPSEFLTTNIVGFSFFAVPRQIQLNSKNNISCVSFSSIQNHSKVSDAPEYSSIYSIGFSQVTPQLYVPAASRLPNAIQDHSYHP